jgi:hypothetical protein
MMLSSGRLRRSESGAEPLERQLGEADLQQCGVLPRMNFAESGDRTISGAKEKIGWFVTAFGFAQH